MIRYRIATRLGLVEPLVRMQRTLVRGSRVDPRRPIVRLGEVVGAGGPHSGAN